MVTRSNGFTVRTDFSDQTGAMPAQDHHGVHVFVPFQRGIATGRHFKIAKLAAKLRFREKHLTRDRLERRRTLLFVRLARDLIPAIVAECAKEALLLDVHRPYR